MWALSFILYRFFILYIKSDYSSDILCGLLLTVIYVKQSHLDCTFILWLTATLVKCLPQPFLSHEELWAVIACRTTLTPGGHIRVLHHPKIDHSDVIKWSSDSLIILFRMWWKRYNANTLLNFSVKQRHITKPKTITWSNGKQSKRASGKSL